MRQELMLREFFFLLGVRMCGPKLIHSKVIAVHPQLVLNNDLFYGDSLRLALVTVQQVVNFRA